MTSVNPFHLALAAEVLDLFKLSRQRIAFRLAYDDRHNEQPAHGVLAGLVHITLEILFGGGVEIFISCSRRQKSVMGCRFGP